MKIGRLLFACLLLAPGFVLAQTEGIANFRLSMHGSQGAGPDGQYSIFFSRSALRMEMQMEPSATAGRRPDKGGSKSSSAHKMTMIQKLAEPDLLYMVSDEQKTYSVMDLAKAREQAGKQPEDAWTVKRLGRDSVAGFSCEKALMTSSKGNEMEICVANDLPVSNAWWSAMNRGQRGSDRWMKTMQDAGIKGLPIRMKVRSARGATDGMQMELVSLEKKSLPGSLFEIPAGYRKVDSGSAVNDALSKMTPEQRKAYEDAMKRAQEKQ
jgi:hypothetical protein